MAASERDHGRHRPARRTGRRRSASPTAEAAQVALRPSAVRPRSREDARAGDARRRGPRRRGFDPRQDGLRVQPEEQHRGDQRHEDQVLAARQVPAAGRGRCTVDRWPFDGAFVRPAGDRRPPWNIRWYAHSRYTADSTSATRRRPRTARLTNVPSRTRNSLTKLFSPGRPSDASAMNRNTPASTGTRARQTAHPPEVVRPDPVREHPGQQEQRAGRQPVVHHVQHAARRGLQREREDPEHDEPHVRQARVRDQSLHVRLHDRDDRAVEDRDHGQHQHHGPEVDGRLREQRQVEPDQPVRADLRQQRRQDQRTGDRRLRVRVGLPGWTAAPAAPSPRTPRRTQEQPSRRGRGSGRSAAAGCRTSGRDVPACAYRNRIDASRNAEPPIVKMKNFSAASRAARPPSRR